MRNKIITTRTTSSTSRVAILALLILYVAGTSRLELLHSFIHDHEITVSHLDKDENDPCHRSLYHNDLQQGCHHDSHAIVSDKCPMCDQALHGDQALLSDSVCSLHKFDQNFFSFYKDNLDSYGAVISSSRAPPALG